MATITGISGNYHVESVATLVWNMQFEDAAQRIEQKMGLEGQPRVIVFHEKEGGRHMHMPSEAVSTQKP